MEKIEPKFKKSIIFVLCASSLFFVFRSMCIAPTNGTFGGALSMDRLSVLPDKPVIPHVFPLECEDMLKEFLAGPNTTAFVPRSQFEPPVGCSAMLDGSTIDCREELTRCHPLPNREQALVDAAALGLREEEKIVVVLFVSYQGLTNQLINLRNGMKMAHATNSTLITYSMNCNSKVFGVQCPIEDVIDVGMTQKLFSSPAVNISSRPNFPYRPETYSCTSPIHPYEMTACLQRCWPQYPVFMYGDFFEHTGKQGCHKFMELRHFAAIQPSAFVMDVYRHVQRLLEAKFGCSLAPGHYYALHGRWEAFNLLYFMTPEQREQADVRKMQMDLVMEYSKGVGRYFAGRLPTPPPHTQSCVFVASGEFGPMMDLQKLHPDLVFVHKDQVVLDPATGKFLSDFEFMEPGDPKGVLNIFSAYVDQLFLLHAHNTLFIPGDSTFAITLMVQRCFFGRNSTTTDGRFFDCSPGSQLRTLAEAAVL